MGEERRLAFAVYVAYSLLTQLCYSLWVFHFWSVRNSNRAAGVRLPQMLISQWVVAGLQFINSFIGLGHMVIGNRKSVKKHQRNMIENHLNVYQVMKTAWSVYFAVCALAWMLRVYWQYSMCRFDAKQVWKEGLNISMNKPWVLHLSGCFERWQCMIMSVCSMTMMICLVMMVPDLLLNSELYYIYSLMMIAILSVIGLSGMCLLLRKTRDLKDMFGMRREMKHLFALGLLWFASSVMIALLMSRHSFVTELVRHCINASCLTGYFFLSTRVSQSHSSPTSSLSSIHALSPTLRIHVSSPHLTDHHRDSNPHRKRSNSGSLLRRSSGHSGIPPTSRTMFRIVLSDYSSFKLLTEHCASEMSMEGILFIVWYMRVKQMLFVYLRDCDLFDFEALQRGRDGLIMDSGRGRRGRANRHRRGHSMIKPITLSRTSSVISHESRRAGMSRTPGLIDSHSESQKPVNRGHKPFLRLKSRSSVSLFGTPTGGDDDSPSDELVCPRPSPTPSMSAGHLRKMSSILSLTSSLSKSHKKNHPLQHYLAPPMIPPAFAGAAAGGGRGRRSEDGMMSRRHHTPELGPVRSTPMNPGPRPLITTRTSEPHRSSLLSIRPKSSDFKLALSTSASMTSDVSSADGPTRPTGLTVLTAIREPLALTHSLSSPHRESPLPELHTVNAEMTAQISSCHVDLAAGPDGFVTVALPDDDEEETENEEEDCSLGISSADEEIKDEEEEKKLESKSGSLKKNGKKLTMEDVLAMASGMVLIPETPYSELNSSASFGPVPIDHGKHSPLPPMSLAHHAQQCVTPFLSEDHSVDFGYVSDTHSSASSEHKAPQRKVKYARELGTVVRLPSKVLEFENSEDGGNGDSKNSSNESGLPKIASLMRSILCEFVSIDGKNAVNISNDARVSAFNFSVKLTTVSDHQSEANGLGILFGCILCLDRVLHEVTAMLKNDSFQRFVATKEFNDWSNSQ